MKTLEENVTIDEGVNELGVRTELIFEGNDLVVKKSFDTDALLQQAADMRAAQEGQRWGEMRHVGYVDPVTYGKWLVSGKINDPGVIKAYFQDRQALVTFDKYLKK